MRTLFYILVVLAVSLPTAAQDLSVVATLNRTTIGIKDQAVLTVKISGSGKSVPNPVLPASGAVSFYPSGNSSSYQFVNGRMSVSKQHTYTVVPAKTGKFTLGPVTVTRNGKTVSSAPLVLTVKGGSVAAQSTNKQQNAPQGRQAADAHSIFIKTRLSRSSAYVNQQVTLTYELYSNINLSGVSFSSYPQMTGFWTEDLDIPKGKNQSVVNLNGQRYLRVILKKVALFPLSDGDVTIPAAKVKVDVDDFMNDPFAGFFRRSRRSAPQEISADPVRIKVLPLPSAGRPADFKGAVGQYRVSATVDKKSVTAGDPVTVSVKISGTGNIKTVSDPELPVLGDFETYASGSTVNTAKTNDIISGRKSYKYVFIPKSAGTHTIGALTIPYFDPVNKAYRTLTTPAITISAAPGARTEEHVVVSALSKENIKILDRDIRYIRTDASVLRDHGTLVYRTTWFWMLQALPLLLLAGASVYGRHTNLISTDIRYARNRRAHGMARRRLKKARKLLADGKNAVECSAETGKALSDFIGDKLNIAATGATTLQITDMLATKGVAGDIIEQYRRCFEACDFARFASSSVSAEDLRKTLEDAETAIVALEREKLS